MLQGNEEGEGEKWLPEVASPNWTKSLAKIASDNFLPLGMIGVFFNSAYLFLSSSILSGYADHPNWTNYCGCINNFFNYLFLA